MLSHENRERTFQLVWYRNKKAKPNDKRLYERPDYDKRVFVIFGEGGWFFPK